MWLRLEKALRRYPTGVVTANDDAGHPFSFRSGIALDARAQVVGVRVPPSCPVQAGPASLACHSHNEKGGALKFFLVRGALEQEQTGWVFRPLTFVPGAGHSNAGEILKMLRGFSRSTKRYLDRRGMERPLVPWDTIHAATKEAPSRHR